MVNVLGQMLYFQEFHNRRIYVDEAWGGYRRSPEKGVLTGYFTPKIPVIDKINGSLVEILSNRYKVEDYGNQSLYRFQNFFSPFDNHQSANESFFVINVANNYWNMINAYKSIDDGPLLYNKLQPLACDNLQFNEAAKQEIRNFLQSQNVTMFPKKESVALHIRRGDKHIEADATDTGLYIKNLQNIVNRTTITDCFIGTDDYRVVLDAKKLLQENNFTCHIHTLTNSDQEGSRNPHSSDWEQGIHFFATLYQLIHATYFLGTFSSNIGKLVALLRGCDNPDLPSDHYYHSYSVQSDDWGLYP